MIIISPLLDSFVKYRLKNKEYRMKMYTRALQKKLRVSNDGASIGHGNCLSAAGANVYSNDI